MEQVPSQTEEEGESAILLCLATGHEVPDLDSIDVSHISSDDIMPVPDKAFSSNGSSSELLPSNEDSQSFQWSLPAKEDSFNFGIVISQEITSEENNKLSSIADAADDECYDTEENRKLLLELQQENWRHQPGDTSKERSGYIHSLEPQVAVSGIETFAEVQDVMDEILSVVAPSPMKHQDLNSQRVPDLTVENHQLHTETMDTVVETEKAKTEDSYIIYYSEDHSQEFGDERSLLLEYHQPVADLFIPYWYPEE